MLVTPRMTPDQVAAEQRICALIAELEACRQQAGTQDRQRDIEQEIAELGEIRGPRVISGVGQVTIPADVLRIRISPP